MIGDCMIVLHLRPSLHIPWRLTSISHSLYDRHCVCVAASLNMWQEAGIRAVWVRVAIEHSVLVPVVTEVGSCRRHGTGWPNVLASCQQRLIDVKHQLFNAGWVFLTLF